MSKAIDKGTMLNLIIEAKRTDPETGSFAEWLAEYLVEHLPTLTTQNEPLTLEELREMDGQPVWVQTPGIEKYGRWVIVAGANIEDNALYCQGDYTCRDYGKMWIAYAYPPANIDREAWVCELCKGEAHVSGTAYSKTPVDKDHVLFVSFSDEGADCDFRYCPNCGRPLTPEAWAELEKRVRG